MLKFCLKAVVYFDQQMGAALHKLLVDMMFYCWFSSVLQIIYSFWCEKGGEKEKVYI